MHTVYNLFTTFSVVYTCSR